MAYASQEILLVLTLGGLAYVHFTPWIAAVVALMTVVVLSYQQVVRACPSGGGSYEVVSANLGEGAGPVVGAALLVDGTNVPLKVLDSPYREVTRPVVDHVRPLSHESPRDMVGVYIPEYVVGRWWENLLHNQSALRIKSAALTGAVRSPGGRVQLADTADRRFTGGKWGA